MLSLGKLSSSPEYHILNMEYFVKGILLDTALKFKSLFIFHG